MHAHIATRLNRLVSTSVARVCTQVTTTSHVPTPLLAAFAVASIASAPYSTSAATATSLPTATMSAAATTPAATASTTEKKPVVPLSYESIVDADVQKLDTSSNVNPLPELPLTKLGELISPDGAVIYLVRRPGCALCRGDGKELTEVFQKYFPSASSESSSSAASQPRLLALVKENLDEELRNFLPIISPAGGELLLHKDRSLYKGLGQRKLGWADVFSWTTIKKYFSDHKLTGGNLKGEGFIPGAIIVVGSPSQGILFTHLENMGHKVDWTPIAAAIAKIKGAKSQDPEAAASEVAAAAVAKKKNEPVECSTECTRP